MKNRRNFIFFTISAILVSLMVMLSEITGEREIIFPEITALALGCIVAPKQPWKVTKLKLFFAITINSALGVLIARYVKLPLFVNIILGYVISIVLLNIMKISFYPMISAIILPVIIGTTSIIYPVCAISMTGIILIIQILSEHYGFKEKPVESMVKEISSFDFLVWIVRLALVCILALVCVKTGYVFAIAPPLLVAFTELSDTNCKARNKPIHIYLLVCSGAVTGSILRYALNVKLGVPLCLCTMMTMIILFIFMNKFSIFFPPAGAIATLSMLVKKEMIMIYPVQIIIGFFVLMCLSLLVFRQNKLKINV